MSARILLLQNLNAKMPKRTGSDVFTNESYFHFFVDTLYRLNTPHCFTISVTLHVSELTYVSLLRINFVEGIVTNLVSVLPSIFQFHY